MAHSAAALQGGDNQQAGEAVEDKCEDEEDQSEFDQRFEIKIAGGFAEFVGDDGGDGIAGGKQRSADNGAIADNHGDGHGLAKCAGERQKDRAEDAAPGKGYDHFPSRFPASGAKRESGFALVARDREEHFARDGNNVGNDHDGEDDAGGQKSDAVGRALKEREEAEGMLERGLNVLTHQRNNDEDTKEAIDDAGNGGEKINEKFERIGNPCRGELREKDGGTDAEGDGDDQRNGGRDEGAVNERQRTELAKDGIPDGGAEKIEAEFVPRKDGALPQFENEEQGDQNDGSG